MRRRNFLALGGAALAGWSLAGPGFHTAGAADHHVRVGMTDWNLDAASDPEAAVPAAARVGLDGIQVSVGTAPDRMPLRDPAVRRRYQTLGREHGIAYPSVAAGSILNRIPLKSEPQAAVYAIDAIEAAEALGANNVMLAFFGRGDLRRSNEDGNYIDVSDDLYREYELDEEGLTRVVEAARQIAPRAEDAGVVIGLENTLTARQNLGVLERIGSEAVKVYYDVGNSTAYGYNVPEEIRLLGSELICGMHIKENLHLDREEKALLGMPEEDGVDFDGVADAVREIGYDGWFVLETSGRREHFVEDTQANIDFTKNHFE